jgi:hypothetical protein
MGQWVLLAMQSLQWRRLGLLQYLRQPRKMLHACSSSLGVQSRRVRYSTDESIAHPIISYNLNRTGSRCIRSLQATHFPGRMRYLPPFHSALCNPLPLFLMHLFESASRPLRAWKLRHLYKLLQRTRDEEAHLRRERTQRVAPLLARASDDYRQV